MSMSSTNYMHSAFYDMKKNHISYTNFNKTRKFSKKRITLRP